MHLDDFTKFFHIQKYGKYTITSQLEDNFKSFLDWAFLNIGAYTNVNRPTTNALSGSAMYKLRLSTEPSLPSGRAWESSRKDWVWESGVSYGSGSPNNFSGVYVNNTFYPAPSGSGSYTYKVNYPLGRITFNSSVASTSNVEASYSFRNVQIYKSNESDWFREIQKYSYDPSKFNNIKEITANHRIQMPAIVLELTPRTILKPYEIGSTTNIIYQDILLHVLTENFSDRAIILDILLQQKDRPLMLYDINKVVNNNAFPLNFDGTKNPNGKIYPELVNNNQYKLQVVYIKDASVIDINNYGQNLFVGTFRYTVEIFP